MENGSEVNGGGAIAEATAETVVVNGTSSSSAKHHKSEHKDKHRDRDRDKDRDKNRHRSDKDKDRDKDKNRHSSSSKSSHKDKDRDRDRDRDKEKSRDKEKEKDRQRDRDKEHKSSHSSSSKDKDRHGSSKDKDKERHSSSHHSSSSSSKDKHRDKEKEKDRHSSSHREKDRDRDKHRDKSSHSSSKDNAHKDRDHKSSDDKDRKRGEPEIKKEKEKPMVEEVVKEEVVIKVEPASQLNSSQDESADDEGDSQAFGDSSLDDGMNSTVKDEEPSDDEKPLSMREVEEEDEEDTPLFARASKIKSSSKKSKKRKREDYSEDEEEFKPVKKKTPNKAVKRESRGATSTTSPKKGKKQEEEEVWKWWEEKKVNDGTKWHFLEHKGPLFAPEYEPLPSSVKFSYDGKEMKLSQDAEEVATFYAKMLNHDYTSKDAFNENFFKDWRKCMNEKERAVIRDLSKCNFKKMFDYFTKKSEERKAMSKEEKKKIKEQNDEIQKEYGFCTIDGHKEKIGNFRIEPPGLFRGRGEHPKMGMLKRRVMPEDVMINCSKDAEVPKAPSGHRWKKVQHDNTVTWLASWTENVQGNVKYVMLNPSSKLKGEKDMMKYETARKLAKKIDKIRETYINDWKSKEMRIRQRAVALYFIDRLALRAGNEKDEDQADTVGCCSLRVEHVQLKDELNGKECVVVFDFLGKDSIRYYNEVPVEKRVYKNLKLFMENKKNGDDLFDRLNTGVLNAHLHELMDGLTAKVFRTYNASITLQNQLNELTNEDDSVAEKMLSYNRANRAVAILCNHQRAVPKTHEKSMENLKAKLDSKREQIDEAKQEAKQAKRNGDSSGQEKAKKKLERLKDQLMKLEVQETDKEENKTIALGTSKLNYLDPRISVAWCKKYDVPIEKVYNKTQRDKFRWAIDMAGPEYVF